VHHDLPPRKPPFKSKEAAIESINCRAVTPGWPAGRAPQGKLRKKDVRPHPLSVGMSFSINQGAVQIV
jgi:hypothetical protein